MLFYEKIFFGSQCDNACEYCETKEEAQTQSLEDIVQHIDLLDDPTNLLFSGGEPSLHSELLPAISYARKRGAKRIKMLSNGRRLADMDFLASLVEAGCRLFEVKLEGATPEVHDGATGVRDSFGETLQGIENLSAFGTDEEYPDGLFVAVRVGVGQANLGDLISLVGMLGSFGIDCITLARKSTDFPIREGAQWVANALKVATLNRTWAQSEGFPPCVMTGCERHVAECIDVRYRSGEKPKGCKKCVYETFCQGPPQDYIQKNGPKEFKAVTTSPYIDDMKRLHAMRFPHGQP